MDGWIGDEARKKQKRVRKKVEKKPMLRHEKRNYKLEEAKAKRYRRGSVEGLGRLRSHEHEEANLVMCKWAPWHGVNCKFRRSEHE